MMTKRKEFTLTACAVASFAELLSWAMGFGFDFSWVISLWILIPLCAWLMPDRES